MQTVQMTLDPELIVAVDKVVKRLGTTRSAFTRDALRLALKRLRTEELERKQREGYQKHPVTANEFDWEGEQAWGD